MTFDLAVIGLGYVGMPLATAATRVGLRTLGFDIDTAMIESLRSGVSHVEDVSAEEVRKALDVGLVVSTDPALLRAAEAYTICVPTPLLDNEPDLTAVIAAARTVAEGLTEGNLVVLESTTYPGTTEEVVRPILEEGSGLRAGSGFRLAYSPERIDPGNTQWRLDNTPKIVGGIDQESTDAAAALYGKFCSEVVVVSSPQVAEMAKLLENTYRHVNIALVNEMAILCNELGIDLQETIRAAATKPFGFQPFYPGPGVGGHCIPVDPGYLSYRVRQLGFAFHFVDLAQEINNKMPQYVAEQVGVVLDSNGLAVPGSEVLLLGVAYKADVGDTRETPARAVVRHLREMGARVRYADPLVDSFEVDGLTVDRADDILVAVGDADIAVILAPHRAFDLPAICEEASLVLDTRGVAPPGTAYSI